MNTLIFSANMLKNNTDYLQSIFKNNHLDSVIKMSMASELNSVATKYLMHTSWTKGLAMADFHPSAIMAMPAMKYIEPAVKLKSIFQIVGKTPLLDIQRHISNWAYLSGMKKINSFMSITEETMDYAINTEEYDCSFEDIYQQELSLNISKDNDGIVLSETATIRKLIREIYLNNEEMYKIAPRKFEEMVAELLMSQGFQVELTKQTRDGGYDILALKSNGRLLLPTKYLVECKKYTETNKVDVNIIRSFSFVVEEQKANKGIIFTTSYFTKDAQAMRANKPWLLDFADRNDLIKWINNYILQLQSFSA